MVSKNFLPYIPSVCGKLLNMKCCRCKEEKERSEFHKNQHYCKPCQRLHRRGWWQTLTVEQKRHARRNEDKQGQNKRRQARKQALRREMLTEYGGCCTCCGETEYKFLTLEHLNGGGNSHRRKFHKADGTWADLKRQGWPKEGLTILCWNCQMAKTHYGKCPHKFNS